jgi:hypothetical protein
MSRLILRRSNFRSALLASVAALAAATFAGGEARAVPLEFGEVTGSFDTTLTLGAQFRVQGRDPDLIGRANGGRANSINGDDGNLNYGKGLTSFVARATHELSLSYQNFSTFVRGTYFYDFKNAERDNTDFRDLTKAAQLRVGRDIDLLDAFVRGEFALGETARADIRIGNQVLNWGESTFLQNGVNIINPLNVSAVRVPGTEVREALLPIFAASGNFAFTENLSAELFYQFRWKKTEPEAAGTFLSNNDFAAPGGNGVYLGFGDPRVPDNLRSTRTAITPFGSLVPRGIDDKPKDGGQFGIALRYFASQLNDTEFGFYYVRYHSRLPVISAQTGRSQTLSPLSPIDFATDSRYLVEYPEKQDMIGVSFNTSIGTVAVQGEYSFKKDQPLQLDDVELLQAALAPAAVTGTFGQVQAAIQAQLVAAGVPPAAAAAQSAALALQNATFRGTLGVFSSNQIIRDLGGIDPTNPIPSVGRFFNSRIQGWRPHDVSQAQVTVTNAFGPAIGASQWLLVAELGVTHVHGMPEKSVLRFDGPGTVVGGNPAFVGVGGMPSVQTEGFADKTSWGYEVRVRFDYLNAIGAVNLLPQISFRHDVNGTTPLPIGNFMEGRKALGFSVQAQYLSQWTAELGYTKFFGGKDFNTIKDRDFIALSIKYSF